eukprot:GEMP01032337.1.p1 GENE.GEMP01032337.1~~GEMP01032337.1.p1  ORF type:complete len:503 (+),score=102.44 GEMP01032337.1:222-1730(+)
MSPDLALILQDVPVNLLTDPSQWSVEDVLVWLQWLGLDELCADFRRDAVDGAALLSTPDLPGRLENPLLEEAIIPLRQRHYSEQHRCLLRVIDGALLRREGVSGHPDFHNSLREALEHSPYFIVPSGASGGRNSASNVVVLHENFVSRRHFKLEFAGDDDETGTQGKWYLSDLGSTTGTFIMVKDTLLLKEDMILQIGISEILVSMDGNMQHLHLEVTEGPNIGSVTSIHRHARLSIGRDPNCTLSINDIQISAVHAQVFWCGSSRAFVLEDQFSTNRTWLRLSVESRSSELHLLDVGDVFKVGSTWFMHVEEESEEPAEDATLLRTMLIDGDETSDNLPNAEVYAALLRDARLRMRATVNGDQGAHPVVSARRMRASSRRTRRAPETTGEVFLAAAGFSGLRNATSIGVLGTGAQQQLLAQQRQLEVQLNNSSAQIRYARNRHEGVGNDDTTHCKICYDRKMECVFVPCGHFMCCARCGDRVSECPVCRAAISMLQRVYDA